MNLYYTPPSDECFEDMKTSCLAVWSEMDDTYGYATEKMDRVRDIKNIEDNFVYMFAMFNFKNMSKVIKTLHPKTKAALKERLIEGGDISRITLL